MKNFFKRIFIKDAVKIDIIFLAGIFFFAAILIIGLFPSEDDLFSTKDFFISLLMLVPIIAAIYFLSISFRRSLMKDSFRITTSIRNKMAFAFIFIAILPSLAIIFASNNFINTTFARLISDKPIAAFNEAINMANEPKSHYYNSMEKELDLLNHIINNIKISPNSQKGRNEIEKLFKFKNISLHFFKVRKYRGKKIYNSLEDLSSQYAKGILTFLNATNPDDKISINKLYLAGSDFIVGFFRYNNYFVALKSKIPEIVKERENQFVVALADYKRLEGLKTYYRSSAGLFLLILAIVLIVVSVGVSAYLAKNITYPILQLSEAANNIAHGDFNVNLKINSNDELGFLCASFNQMGLELENSRDAMYQKQKIEAWRDMARRLVHEIKNPLTPIRLSAEIIKKRFIENHPEKEKSVISGTEMIIEEVDLLMNLLGNFTKFARLPEMKPEHIDINKTIENCVLFFHGHEEVEFIIKLDEKIKTAFIDKILFRQALINIIQNSIDAIKENGIIEIISTFLIREKENIISISVIDNGIGVREYNLKNIFEPGYSKKSNGTGLGLAIVEKIILEHGGKIYCRSEFGKWTEIIMELPSEKNISLTESGSR